MAALPKLQAERILLTRSAEDCAAWATRISECGAQAIVMPCIETRAIDTPSLRSALADGVTAADWLVFTSRRGVECCRALLGPSPGGQRMSDCRIAAVGAATAEAAARCFGHVDHVGAGTGTELAELLVNDARLGPGTRAALVVAENARDTVQKTLEAAGVRCERFNVYRTVPKPVRNPKQTLSALGADNIVLASPSAVVGFIHQVDVDTAAAIYTIGPSTTAAAEAHGLQVAAQAREPSLEGLLEAMRWRS